MTTPEVAVKISEPKGIGGWLVLPAIGTCLSPLYMAYATWENFAGFGPGMPPSLFGAVVFDLVVCALLTAGWIYAVVLLFNRSARFPTWYVGLVAAGVARLFVVMWWLNALGYDGGVLWTNILGMLIGAVIWIPYMLNSKRVQATFTAA